MRAARWILVVLLVGAVYLVAGLVSAQMAGSAESHGARVAWRLAAWVISAIAFGAQIQYEHTRLLASPAATALHASLAVALGGFALAVAASLHAQATGKLFPAFALAVWPVMMALPAFVVAFAAAALLTRVQRSV
jgi:F0F1-type ATP synthase membrane subunit a